MDQLPGTFDQLLQALRAAGTDLVSAWFLIQLAAIAVLLAVSAGAGLLFRRHVDLAPHVAGWPPLARLLAQAVTDNLGTILFVVLAGALRTAMIAATWPSRSYLIGVAASLASAWVVIALVTVLIRNPFVHRMVAIAAWTIAALSILGLLTPVTAFLDSVAVTFGGLRVSPLLVLKTALLLLVALWLATSLSNFLELRVRSAAELTPSMQVLVAKLLRVGIITVAVLIVIHSVGIDLSAFALFGGAIAVGIGFGLQKIVSNFVSGIILLADKSIKPGDIISVGNGFGWVEMLGARYTLVGTRDGREFLIPNEDLVTQQVVNWSHTDNRVRIEVKFGVSYKADPHRVIALALETVLGTPRVLADPQPLCFLTEFGDSSVNFALGFWIDDPAGGISNVRSAVLLRLWDACKKEGIDFPFPQRDVHFVTPLQLASRRPSGS